MEKFPQENQVPFKDDLVRSRISEHQHKDFLILREVKNNPNKIIRTVGFGPMEYEHENMDGFELAALGKKLHKELEENYDIPVPVEYVVGKEKDGHRVIYGITDRIVSSLENNEITPQLVEAEEKFYVSLSKYYLDKSGKLSDGEFFLTDIRGRTNHVYGKKAGDTQPKMYLIDTDLHMHNDKLSFYYVAYWLIRHMSSVEEKTGKQFDIARENIKRILKNPDLEGLKEDEKETIKKTIIESNNSLRGEFSKEGDDLPSGNFRGGSYR